MIEVPYRRFRKDLTQPIERRALPDGMAIAPLTAANAEAAHRLLSLAFPDRDQTLSDWYDALLSDDEYDPTLVMVATDANDSPVGLIQSWTSAFIKDLAVDPARRRSGVASALLLETFALFAARRAPHVDLKVEVGNLGAQQLYRTLGMVEVSN